MSVVVETTLGDITIDLYTKERPKTCLNFLKLCKIKYYNFNLFHSVQHNFLAQTGDPTGSGHGGESIFGTLYGTQTRYYAAEQLPKIKHTRTGLVSMVNCGDNMLGAQFFITLGTELTSLDNEHCVFGEVTEGEDVLLKLNETICDETNRPYQDIRITHTIILEDPFDDPPNLKVPDRSPSPSAERLMNGRIAPDEAIDEMNGKTMEEIEELVQEKEAAARATILEIVGDLPDAEMAPPENVLFVCKLNPVTDDADLEIIFSRFGKINSCEVIRDKVSGDSLQYAFIEFAEQKSCEDAYFKMDNVLIDDRRIHVDFSQSVAKIKWKGKGRGVDYLGGKPGEKVETERHRSDKNDRNDKYSDRSSKPHPRSPVVKNRGDDRRGSSRDIRRDYPRRNDVRRREERPRSRERHRSRSPHNKSRNRNRENERSRPDSRDDKSKNVNRPRSRDTSNKDRDRGSSRRSRERNTIKEKPSRKEEPSEPQTSKQNHVNEIKHSSVEKIQVVETTTTTAVEINGNKHDSQDSTMSDVINAEKAIKEEKDKSVSSTSTSEKPKESSNNKEIEVSSKKRSREEKHSTQSESSSESSSEESSSSSSEPRKKRRKKSRTKKVLIIKKKGRSLKHKKRKVPSDTDTSSDDSSSSDSESEPRKSKHKKRKKRTEIVKIISRKASHKKRKKRVETSSESSSSESDVPRKKKKSKKSSTKNKNKKEKNKRKHASESESSSSEEPTSKRKKSSRKGSKKKQTSESGSSSE